MNEEVLSAIVARLSAQERVLTLLLSEQLKRLPEGDALVLKMALDPTGVAPPKTDDLGLADDLAGRTIAYHEAVGRILRAAQEIAGLTAG